MPYRASTLLVAVVGARDCRRGVGAPAGAALGIVVRQTGKGGGRVAVVNDFRAVVAAVAAVDDVLSAAVDDDVAARSADERVVAGTAEQPQGLVTLAISDGSAPRVLLPYSPRMWIGIVPLGRRDRATGCRNRWRSARRLLCRPARAPLAAVPKTQIYGCAGVDRVVARLEDAAGEFQRVVVGVASASATAMRW